jgi:hypothetical protein
MSNPNAEASLERVSEKIESVVLGFKWLYVPPLVLFSVLNFSTARSIDKFAQIFTDALPGKPLSLLTTFLIHSSSFLTALALLWPVLGVLTLRYGKRVRNWVIVVNVILLLMGLQIALTWVGCITPMIDDDGGHMSDQSSR